MVTRFYVNIHTLLEIWLFSTCQLNRILIDTLVVHGSGKSTIRKVTHLRLLKGKLFDCFRMKT